MKSDKKHPAGSRKGFADVVRNFSIDYQDDDILLANNIEFEKNPSPVKISRNVFYICHSGCIEFDTPEGHYSVNAGDTFVCPAGTYVSMKIAAPGTKFSALSLTDRVVQSLLNANIYIWNNIIYVLKERVVHPETGGNQELEKQMGWHFAEIVRTLLTLKGKPFYKEMIYLMLQMMLLGFCAKYRDKANRKAAAVKAPKKPVVNRTNKLILPGTRPRTTKHSQVQILFSKFMELLQKEPVKHQPVSYYAEKLCISSKYLSYVCKAVSGKSALEFIQNAVIGEIMHYLDNTNMSVKEISCRMGFPNVSFFGKYVKTHLGLSPNKYRK